MESRVERVVLETDRSRIVGDLTLPREGYRSRLSDYLNRGDLDFIPLINAEITSLSTSEQHSRRFVVVARNHIHLAYPHSPTATEDVEPTS
ncbi:MAG TPA: hypothetical protein VHF58_00170 [Solirubrobacterales bacterium]|nr:hypothetical protein [Solirubrobacterales bacterium]